MADAAVRDFLTCSICLDTFVDPVSLSCNHSFCSSCVQKHWVQDQSRSCPLCRKRDSKELIINFSLKQLSDDLRLKLQKDQTQDQTQRWSGCSVHPQVPPLFCLDEACCFCALCEFRKHKDHEVLSEEEAEEQLKQPLRSQLQTLKKTRQTCEDLHNKYDQIQNQSEKQALHCERQISAVFHRLRRHLQEEQDTALRALRQEQDRQKHLLMSQRTTLRDKLSSVDLSIQQLEEHLQTPAQDFLLTPPVPTGLRQDQDQDQDQDQTPLPTGLMLDQAKVLGNLGFRVWRSLRRAVRHSPVVLDPNTADRRLYLSEDLSAVTQGDTLQDLLPDLPERFSKYATVLGSEGFISGTHQWDVEVGDHPGWTIGVAQESTDRKGKIFARPEYGIWCLWHGDGKYIDGCNKPVTVEKRPEKIRVKLDHAKGTVSFYDAGHMTHLLTHTHTWTERMFPLFSIGPSKDAKTKEIHICETPGED